MPTPKILDWSDDPSNAIGSEYTTTEHAAGVQSVQRWQTMSEEQLIDCIQAICKNIHQLASIELQAYGSLYFVDAPLRSASILPLPQGFRIGPYCAPRYWRRSEILPFDEAQQRPL